MAHRKELPDEILTEILARLPLRSISRFKTVCRRWKWAMESVYFRRLFVSVHQNSSCGWSLVAEEKEFFNFHGCETWGLPKSIASYLVEMVAASGNELYLGAFSSSGLVLVGGPTDASYVGNPVLQEWVIIPPCPYRYPCISFGLATPTDKDGVALGFKAVFLAAVGPWRDKSSTFVSLCVYSSETGIWTFKRLRCPLYLTIPTRPISLNGTLYFSQTSFRRLHGDPVAIFTHDFYGETDLCRAILLPDQNPGDLTRALTASCGFVMYIKTLGDNLLKAWRLNTDDSWQLLWDIPLQFDIRFYLPISMHPYDCHLVYLWSQKNRFLVSCNLKTQNYKNLSDDNHHQGFSLNQSVCQEYLHGVSTSNRSLLYEYDILPLYLFQLVLPQWMESMPCPPQLEMMDTTSLLAYVASLPQKNTLK